LRSASGRALNFRFYSHAVDRVCGIDLSPELLRLAHTRTTDAVVPVSLLRSSAEHLPFADAVFDTVVMTWTLCSIANPVAALIEMRRVLNRAHGGVGRSHLVGLEWARRLEPQRAARARRHRLHVLVEHVQLAACDKNRV
jgi:ubiquinone/menaquinone biosynthesis C-methylase UbiE